MKKCVIMFVIFVFMLLIATVVNRYDTNQSTTNLAIAENSESTAIEMKLK